MLETDLPSWKCTLSESHTITTAWTGDWKHSFLTCFILINMSFWQVSFLPVYRNALSLPVPTLTSPWSSHTTISHDLDARPFVLLDFAHAYCLECLLPLYSSPGYFPQVYQVNACRFVSLSKFPCPPCAPQQPVLHPIPELSRPDSNFPLPFFSLLFSFTLI